MKRCSWAEGKENMRHYHDTVWGIPVYDSQQLYRKLMLDINQAGLSWQTILNKEAAFDEAYDYFDYHQVAHYDEKKKQELLTNAGIIRNRLKINAAIVNAQAVLKMEENGENFSDFLWGFTNGEVIVGNYSTFEEIPTKTALSDEITKALKQRGFTFVGSTTVYAFLQAVGIVNDHVIDCYRYQKSKGE